MKKIFLCLVLLGIAVSFAEGETIIMKDGKKIIGDIVNRTDKTVTISQGGGAFVYTIKMDRVSDIRDSTPEELAQSKRSSQQHSATSTDTGRNTADTASDRQEKLRKYRQERYETEVELAKKARGRIEIPFVNNQTGVVATTINGKTKAVMYVDTGASLVIISRAVANQIGITQKDIKGKLQVVLANGSTDIATAVNLKSVQVGSSSVKDVRAAITENPPGPGIDGLLGMTFLEHFHVKLDSKKNCLVLEKY